MWLAAGETLRPALAGENTRGSKRFLECFLGGEIAGDEILQATAQAARARSAALIGADKPAPQFRAFPPRQSQRKRIVGGIKKVMPLIEHVACRQIGIIKPAERRLNHDERMVG